MLQTAQAAPSRQQSALPETTSKLIAVGWNPKHVHKTVERIDSEGRRILRLYLRGGRIIRIPL